MAGAGGLLLATKGKYLHLAQAAIPGGSLDPNLIPKYGWELVKPPAMPSAGRTRSTKGKNPDYYVIAMRQFSQQVLPGSLPMTTVWSYGSANHPESFNYPAFSIEARWNRPVRVKWVNDLVDENGDFLPHLLPVDQTVHWANPPGPRDHHSMDPSPYLGPVPMVTHVHGAHVSDESDGYAEAWWLPKARNIPATYYKEGTWYDFFKGKFAGRYGVQWEPGTATFQYPNDQRATTMWYHDHTLGMTRLNVYAGPAGFYLLRGGPHDMQGNQLPGPAPSIGSDPFGTFYEIPLAIQDRSFNDDGSLFYPDSRAFFDEYPGPYIPNSPVAPIWNPEFFGNTMLVNGRTWPFLNVEQRRYRFRFLNGCDSRFLILKMDNNLPFYQIGAEGGFLPAPVQLSQLIMSPAERADVIVDFTNVPVGTEITLLNLGPDEPFKGFNPDGSLSDGEGGTMPPSDTLTTGQVMQFRVGPALNRDISQPAMSLVLPAFTPLPAHSVTRQVSLNEEMYMPEGMGMDEMIPIAAVLGTVDLTDPANPAGQPLKWMDPISENPAPGATEVWEIYNFTADAHPIHLHEVMFEVIDRQPIGGASRLPEAWETGTKDTVIAYPGEITRIKSTFDLPGQYVWHCHIVEHEDNEMMRPYRIGPEQPGQPGMMG